MDGIRLHRSPPPAHRPSHDGRVTVFHPLRFRLGSMTPVRCASSIANPVLLAGGTRASAPPPVSPVWSPPAAVVHVADVAPPRAVVAGVAPPDAVVAVVAGVAPPPAAVLG